MRALARELLVERDSSPQDAVEDIGGYSTGGEAGDFRLGRGARSRHAAIIADELCRGHESNGKNIGRAPLWLGAAENSRLSCISALPQIALARLGVAPVFGSMFPN